MLYLYPLIMNYPLGNSSTHHDREDSSSEDIRYYVTPQSTVPSHSRCPVGCHQLCSSSRNLNANPKFLNPMRHYKPQTEISAPFALNPVHDLVICMWEIPLQLNPVPNLVISSAFVKTLSRNFFQGITSDSAPLSLRDFPIKNSRDYL
jgi:hypothetical protein